jgi:hypothetical protein
MMMMMLSRYMYVYVCVYVVDGMDMGGVYPRVFSSFFSFLVCFLG